MLNTVTIRIIVIPWYRYHTRAQECIKNEWMRSTANWPTVRNDNWENSFIITHLTVHYYLTNRSGWAKKSAYISSNDRFSRINVGRTTLVRSMPMRTWERRWVIRLPWDSIDSTANNIITNEWEISHSTDQVVQTTARHDKCRQRKKQ